MPAFRALITLAWPIVVSRSAQVVVGIADAVMVSHLGPSALAATTAGAMNAFSLFILPMGTVFVVASFSSQLQGAGDPGGARRYGWYGLAVAAATQAAALASIGWIGPALGLFAFEPEVRGLLHGYLALRLWSSGAAVGLEALGSYYGGLGNTRLPMLAQVLAMALNVAGNWLLIDGHLGLPGMGVRGAALASAIATTVAFCGLLAVFALVGARPAGRLRLAELGRLLRFGVPSGLNWFFEFLAFLFFVNVVVAGLGTRAVAAFMSVIQLSSVAFMPSFALASAGAILVGQAIGRGRKDEVPGVVRVTFLAAGGWQLLAGLAYLIVPEVLLAGFARDPGTAAPLLAIGARMLRLSVAWALFDAAAATLAEALRAAGDTAWPLWARLAIAWAIFAPGSWLTVTAGRPHADLLAVGWMVLYLGLLAAALYARFRGGAWRRIVLVEAAAG